MTDLLDRARKDMQKITNKEFSVQLTFTANTGETAAVRGLASKHHLGINPETGAIVNVKNTHVSVAEADLVAESYPVRNANKDVAMYNHLVTYTDSAGNEFTYRVNDAMPDETLGIIVLTLGDYE